MDGNSSWISLAGIHAIWKIKGLSARPTVEWRNVQNKTCSVYNKVMDWRANGQTRHGLYLKVFNTRDGVTCCDATFTSMLQTRSKQQLLNLTDILVGVIHLEIPAQSLAVPETWLNTWQLVWGHSLPAVHPFCFVFGNHIMRIEAEKDSKALLKLWHNCF